MNEDLFQNGQCLTFDDVLILPDYAEVAPDDVDVSVRLAPGLHLKIPILSAAMDTVTEARLAIALARQGGMGIIHRNLSPERQAGEVDKVKRSQSGMIVDPVTLPVDATVGEAEEIMSTYHISGVPITGGGRVLKGILTNRDIRFVEEKDFGHRVSRYMSRPPLVTAAVGITLAEAQDLLQEHRIEKLPLVDEDGVLKGLITVKDIQKKRDFPLAANDAGGQLLAGAAVGVGGDLEARMNLLVEAGVDLVAIDTAHGHSRGVLEAVRWIKDRWPDLPVMAGNVVTADGTRALIETGADIIKVGVGAGSICTTRVVAGAGRPQLTAIYHCARAAHEHGVPVVADGGIKYTGDVVKALAAGADLVMLGSLLAGLKESPGEVVLLEGRRFKEYRGMGSEAALKGYSRDRYGQSSSGKVVPEGIEGRVPYKGELADYVFQLIGGLRAGMGYAGAADLEELRTSTRLTRITDAGLIESHPHDVIITKEAPNYHLSQG